MKSPPKAVTLHSAIQTLIGVLAAAEYLLNVIQALIPNIMATCTDAARQFSIGTMKSTK